MPRLDSVDASPVESATDANGRIPGVLPYVRAARGG